MLATFRREQENHAARGAGHRHGDGYDGVRLRPWPAVRKRNRLLGEP
ncbi:hypothetical protein [Nocardia carnea]|nr:hypothetical protein [Nocardia carnea]